MTSFVETPPGLPELARELTGIMTQLRTLHGSALTVIAAMTNADLARAAGYRSVAALVSDLVRITLQRAARLVTQAGLVAETVTPTGHVTPARLPLVRAALAEGVLDPDHIDVIAAAMTKIPDTAPGDSGQIVEKHLVDLARETHATVLRTHGEALLARIDPDGHQPDDVLAEPVNVFRYRRDRGGRMHFTGAINPETAEELDAMLGALAKPDGPTDNRHHTQRLGDAFCDVVHHAIDADTPVTPGTPDDPGAAPDGSSGVSGSSGLPVRGGEKPHLNLTIDYSQLLQGIGTATLESGAPLPATAARRLACDCGIIPIVLNGASVPLDVGRTRRLVTAKQRAALNIRDHGCAFPHCERPARWTDAHHIISWLDGGPTDLTNLVLVCRRHHRMLHHSEWSVRIGGDGHPEFIPPRWINPYQIPQRNLIHRRE